jgi:alpha-glucosidase
MVGFLCAASASGQTLARPGWAGSGITTEAWWKRAVIYEIDPHNFAPSKEGGACDLKGITARLDYIQSLGVDAILLDFLNPQVETANAVALAQPPAEPAALSRQIDPALGTFDDFDTLSLEASRRNMRVLLNLAEPDEETARFWLNRGVAGFHVTPRVGPSASKEPALTPDALSKLVASFPGGRILLGDGGPAGAASNSSADVQLLLAPAGLLNSAGSGTEARNAGRIRAALDPVVNPANPSHGGESALPVLLSDAPGHPRSFDRYGDGTHNEEIAKLIAAVLLGTRPAALLEYGQEVGLSSPNGAAVAMDWGKVPVAPAAKPGHRPVPPPPPDPKTVVGQDANPQSLLSFYRRLSELHHGYTAMRDGDTIFLPEDNANVLAWVRKPRSVTPLTPAIIVLCNFSDKPATLSLKEETTKLHLRGSFLRTVLRSDVAMGSMDLQQMTLPPYEVFIGEVRY